MVVDRLSLLARLRSEGRWEEAEAFKKVVIEECRRAGMRQDGTRETVGGEVERTSRPDRSSVRSPPREEPASHEESSWWRARR